MLTRIYGTAFAKQDELDAYLKQLEEAEKRDHRRLGRELDLFHFQEEGPGVVFWHAKGWTLFQAIVAYMRRRLAGTYDEVNAPQMLDKSLWETSGHWDWYRENMFAAQSAGDEAEDKRWFAIKPMNCPGHVQIFKHGLKSYRDLPIRLAEFGIVHRYEPSGAMHGLMRVRGFTQDDAHVFCTEEQLAGRVPEDQRPDPVDLCRLRLRRRAHGQALDAAGKARRHRRGVGSCRRHHVRKCSSRSPRESAGASRPRSIPAKARSTGRSSNTCCATRSAATGSAARRRWTSTCRSGSARSTSTPTARRSTPVMVHRAICGSMERFTGILIEHFAGHFPLWLAPVQAVVTTITSDGDDYAKQVLAAVRRAGLRANIDLRNEKINYKVREHSLAKIPALLVVGKKEAEQQTVSIRRLGSDKQQVVPLTEAIAALVDEATPPDVKRANAAG